jgi:hypothetical protein
VNESEVSPVNIILPRFSTFVCHIGDKQQTNWWPQFRDIIIIIIIIMVQRLYQKQVHPHLIDTLNLPCDIEVKVTLVARLLLMLVMEKLSTCEHGVSRMCLFLNITSHQNHLLLIMKAYPEKEVLNKTTIHQLITALEVVI